MTGTAFETWIAADEALFGAGFGSAVADVTFADATIAEPFAAAQSDSDTISVNAPLAPTARDGIVHVIGPVPPIAGVVQLHPAGAVHDWHVVWAGTAVVSETFAAGRSSFVGANEGWLVSALLV